MVFKSHTQVYKFHYFIQIKKKNSLSWKILMNLLFWHDDFCCDIDVKVFLNLQYRIYSGHSID